MHASTVNYKDLILIGGGHSHALVLKMWAMKPLAGVRLTLISPQIMTPYSGMLPGLIAGHYTVEQTHIDLARLCQFAGARFIQAAVSKINLSTNEIHFSDREALGFDLLSINAGITPNLDIEGAQEHSTPVKPISTLYPRWQALTTKLQEQPTDTTTKPYNITVVGGGAAGVELILAMQDNLTRNTKITQPISFQIIQKGQGLPENYPSSTQQRIAERLANKNIRVISQQTVVRVDHNQVITDQDKSIEFDTLFWCTNARAATWPAQAGLSTDKQGFIATNDHLQSISHPQVFAAGDIAQQQNYPRPRAGVFAVRQGPILFENLQRVLLKKPLKKFRPQKDFLSLLAAGERYGYGCRTGSSQLAKWLPGIAGAWVWRWKNRIDQRFMAMFSQLPAMPTNATPLISKKVAPQISDLQHDKDISAMAMRCGGCGAKVGATVLNRVMSRLQPVSHDGVVLGLDAPDDAAAIQVPTQQLLLQSVDVFRALVDDPYVLGQIAAEHALSDLFAMNAQAHSALAIATLPYAGEALVERDLLQLMSGALSVLNTNQCALIGGHTSEGAELSIGFSVNGTANQNQILQKSQPQIGQHIILTQALGTGTLFAAHNQWQAKGVWIESAIDAMLTSNRNAGKIFHKHNASACTDVTGFGLLGHLIEMIKPSGLSATIQLDNIPALEGALTTLQRGISSSLQPQNRRLQRAIHQLEDWHTHPRYPLLFDPQTSGGLLACVDPDMTDSCLKMLKQAGYSDAVVIGEVTSREETFDELITLRN
jgi:selenide, water dikinase